MIRIDAHHHLWKLGTRPHAWLDGAEMAAIRRDLNRLNKHGSLHAGGREPMPQFV